MAIHCLWYMTLVLWVIDHTGMCERSIDEEWTNVELYNRHEFFYETLIVGMVTYLVSVVPRALLLDRAQLFEQAANNAGHNHHNAHSNSACTLKLLPLYHGYHVLSSYVTHLRSYGAAAVLIRLRPSLAGAP